MRHDRCRFDAARSVEWRKQAMSRNAQGFAALFDELPA